MAKDLHIILQSPEQVLLDTVATMVRVATEDGEVEIMSGHAALVSTISYTTIEVHHGQDQEEVYEARHGILFVDDVLNEVRIMAFDCHKVGDVHMGSIVEYQQLMLKKMEAGDLSPMQVKFAQGQHQSIEKMVEVSQKSKKRP